MAEDTWTQVAYPVLDLAVTHFNASNDALWASELNQAIPGFSADDVLVQQQLKLLEQAGYLVLDRRGDHVASITEVTPKAQEAVGAWPSDASVGDAVVAALEKLADNEPQPERQSALRRAATAVQEIGTSVAGQFFGAALKNAAGL